MKEFNQQFSAKERMQRIAHLDLQLDRTWCAHSFNVQVGLKKMEVE